MEIPNLELKKGEKFFILINLFIKKENIKTWNPNDWLRERSAAKRLLNKYNNFYFFYSLTELQGKFNSLLGLLSKKYQDLDEKYHDFNLAKIKNKSYDITGTKIEILGEVRGKAKSLVQFLDE